MTVAVLAGIGLLGGLGAVARFAVDGAVAQRLATGSPLGTLVVNVGGAFALGILVGAAVHGDAYRLAGTGLLGAYTTFSTWMFESQRLAEDGELGFALLNLMVSLVLGLVAAWAGRRLGAVL
jgi:CrcB protein